MVVLFKNTQWSVTDYGLESVAPAPVYPIGLARLLDTDSRNGAEFPEFPEFYVWPLEMANKAWINYDAFVAAFEQALIIHSHSIGIINAQLVEASLEEGRRTVAQALRRRANRP